MKNDDKGTYPFEMGVGMTGEEIKGAEDVEESSNIG